MSDLCHVLVMFNMDDDECRARKHYVHTVTSWRKGPKKTIENVMTHPSHAYLGDEEN